VSVREGETSEGQTSEGQASEGQTSEGQTSEGQASEGQTLKGGSAFARYANLVKLPHTLFALPFALVGVVLASEIAPVTGPAIFWVVVAFSASRFAAMGFNRIVDRHIDARNPRTAAREIPMGKISVPGARLAVILASAIFVVAAGQLNPLCLALAPVALALVLFYSYTKRFTRWSHLVLGLGLGIAPAGGYLAITGTWSTPWLLLPLLSLAVTMWVGGFDILYALQDVDFDRAENLHSLPSRLGEERALLTSRLLHTLSVLALFVVGTMANAGWLYYMGTVVVMLLLAWEHSLVRPGDYSRMNAAFFTMNGVISVVFFSFVLLERIL
jgi:4-hydroxybenzoate polyprenyltransferase